MDRKELESFSDYKGTSFGIVKEFADNVLDIGEEFLNDVPKPEVLEKKEEKKEPESPTPQKVNIAAPINHLDIGDDILEEDDEEAEPEETEETDALLKDTPKKEEKKPKKEEAKPIVPEGEEEE